MSAGRVDDLALLAVLGALAVVFAVVVWARPRWGLVAYVASIGFVPVWIGAQFGMFVTAGTAAGVVVAAALWSRAGVRLRVWDGAVAFVMATVALSWLGGYLPLDAAYGAAVGWMLPYVVARVLAARVEATTIANVVSVVFTVVAVLAIVEFVTRQNWFVQLAMPNAVYTQWGGIRMRGGLPRAEGAFGNSIPLGACLAMSVPFVWVSTWRPAVRSFALLVIGAAAVLTFSRIGMLSTVLAVVVCLVALGQGVTRRFRVWTAVVLVVGVLVALPSAVAVFQEAGDEASGSAEYRGDLLSLLPAINAVGRSSLAYQDASGGGGWGQFESIDNAFLMVGLTYGWWVLGLLLVMAVAAVVALVRGPRTPALVSIVCTLPGLTSVAFVTQFTVFFWFVAGLAVAQGAAAAAARSRGPQEGRQVGEPVVVTASP